MFNVQPLKKYDPEGLKKIVTLPPKIVAQPPPLNNDRSLIYINHYYR